MFFTITGEAIISRQPYPAIREERETIMGSIRSFLLGMWRSSMTPFLYRNTINE